VDFSLAQIAELLALRNNPQRASADVKTLVDEHIQRLNQKIMDLNNMKNTLESWYNLCGGNTSPQCAIIDGLDKHGHTNSRH
jgi:MerR family transcriptional regulator, copper efflux regulator